MELISLVAGVGLGFVASRIIGSRRKPEVSVASPPTGSPGKIEPLEELKPVQLPVVEDIEPLEELKPVQPPVVEDIEPQAELKPVQPPVVEDIEPLEELKQTQLAYEMAKQVSSFKSGFLARASHELRSPLTSLIGMHQLILSDLCDSPEEEREFIAQANISALKMVKLLTDVIDVSKIEDGKARLEITTLPLSKVFENLQTLTYMQAAHSNLRFEVIAPEPEIYVLADPRRFQQVLVGIVDTAIARMESGRIQVSAASASAQEAQIWIDVESPTPIWSEMTDSLEKTPETHNKAGKTSEMSPGLNLLIAQTVVEVMQGRLELVAVSDQAATNEDVIRLQCSLPLATPESAAPVSA
ncbi:MAG: HAMP domain-containing sensor histidine kinase [Coleofasciculaceae cyanobacterium]